MQESVGHFSYLSCQLDLCEVVSGTGILSVGFSRYDSNTRDAKASGIMGVKSLGHNRAENILGAQINKMGKVGEEIELCRHIVDSAPVS